jgi:radical SAM superfamily enzyme YgiQ (UPF0313 family)
MPSCSRVSFTDDNFPSTPAWIEEFSELYRKHIGLPFRIWFHPNTLKEKQIESLAAAGLRWAKVGIQSASDQTRRQVFGRRESREAIRTCPDSVDTCTMPQGQGFPDLFLSHS